MQEETVVKPLFQTRKKEPTNINEGDIAQFDKKSKSLIIVREGIGEIKLDHKCDKVYLGFDPDPLGARNFISIIAASRSLGFEILDFDPNKYAFVVRFCSLN